MPEKIPADLILYNGKIITVNPDDDIVEAVAVRDGKFTYVGDDDAALSYAGPETKVIDLKGKSVTPGLIDSHIHMQWVGKALQQINCRSPPITSIKDLQEEVKKKVELAKPGDWIIGRGWDQVRLTEHRYPVKEDFDEIAPDNPVVLFRVCEHLAVVNSKALEIAGITRDTPSPPGGKVAKDEKGEPTGMLEELPALSLITSIMPMETEDILVDAVETACHEFNKVGITGVIEPGLTPIEMRAYQQAEVEDRLTVRTNMMYMGNYKEITVPELVKRIEEFQWKNNFGTGLLKFFGLKMFMDGGYGGKTAYTRESYPGEPDNCGLRIMTPEDFQEVVDAVNLNGTRMGVHTCGGAAMDVVLEAYDKTDKLKPINGRRFQIIHAYHPSPENIETIKRLGISVVSQPGFIYYLGDSYVENVDYEKI
ncbi:MAG: amidohydrolase, partial [Candidatus Bathyarchaeota archaeon]|nr:amidohydrolase [Candidatus Bathyarchaeota archaeon]